MNKETPVANRVIHQRDTERNRCILTDKILRIKFANFSALQGFNQTRNRKSSKDAELSRPNTICPRRVRSVMENQRIRSQNKSIFKRLSKQKSTLSNKIFAQQRHRNIEFLKRIGRYPYKNIGTSQIPPIFNQLGSDQQRLDHRQMVTDNGYEDKNSQINVAFSNISQQETQHNSMIEVFLKEESKKQRMIFLWTKVIKLGKAWYTIRYIRLKNNYRIELISYPTPKTRYSLVLGQKQGTCMLSEFDYDYAHISHHCLKISDKYVTLSFQLKIPQKKKYFYRFEKKEIIFESQTNPKQFQYSSIELGARKTMFAIENESNEKKQLELAQLKKNRNKEIIAYQSRNLLQNFNTTDIFLERIKQQ